jgi:hypothetical protein
VPPLNLATALESYADADYKVSNSSLHDSSEGDSGSQNEKKKAEWDSSSDEKESSQGDDANGYKVDCNT